MRLHFIPVALLAACASSPACHPDHGVVGQYWMQDGPEIWLELDLLPGGACTACSCRLVGGLLRTLSSGHWRIEQDEVVVAVDNAEFRFMVGAEKLVIRHWDGHVYLVPPRDLSLFDRCGPMNEFCFSRDGAPLFPDPFSGRADSAQRPTGAPCGAGG
ncbi:MAG TPA: hypothetical protein VFZ65_10055 [Planctomycetota bacterium]|nr:hypothetical protein [Planctomycetota bacterium]